MSPPSKLLLFYIYLVIFLNHLTHLNHSLLVNTLYCQFSLPKALDKIEINLAEIILVCFFTMFFHVDKKNEISATLYEKCLKNSFL